MSVKDYAIGKLSSWLGEKGYELKPKTKRKVTTRPRAKTATMKPTPRKVTARSKARVPSFDYSTARNVRATEFDRLVARARNAYAYVYASKQQPKDIYKANVNDYARAVVNLSNYLKRHGSTLTPDKLDELVDKTISKGVRVKSTLKASMKVKPTKLKTSKRKSVNNARLAKMARHC